MLYKLIVLYMIKIAGIPLTNADISEHILGKGYTDSMTLQLTLSELTEIGLVTSTKKHNRTYFDITKDGLDTINSLDTKLSQEIRSDIEKYLSINIPTIKNDHSIQAGYIENSHGEYECEFRALDKKGELMNIHLTLPTENLAKTACDNFKNDNERIYQFLINELLK